MSRVRVLVVGVAVVLCSIGVSRGAAAPVGPAGFGPAVQVAATNVDFNGDGLDDLAIGAPSESFGGLIGAGAVHVLYGSSSGLTGANSQFWSQDTPGVDDAAEPDDQFGKALAAGDFDGDGFTDLAIGVPFESIGQAGFAGLVHILFGSAEGLQASGSQVWSQATAGVSGSVEPGDGFGGSLVSADFGRGVQADLAIGARGETIGVRESAGVVHVLYGAAAGLSAVGSQLWSQASAGISGSAEAEDYFGDSLAAANVGGSSTADLVIGVAGEAIGQEDEAGGVHVLYGSTAGVAATGSQFWSQDSSGIAGRSELFDAFGASLVVADFGRSRHVDLAIGAPGESLSEDENGVGMVHILYGSSTGLSATGSQVWHQNTSGIPGIAESSDFFGMALTAGDFGRGGQADLAIGMQWESASSHFAAGGVQLLYGSAAGLGTAGNRVFNQDTPGIAGTAEDSDEFGSALAAGNFGSNAQDDLVVGVPNEALGGQERAGVVHVIRGSGTGLTSTGSQLWSQGSAGIVDGVEYDDAFGESLATG